MGDGYVYQYRINGGDWQTTVDSEFEYVFDADGKIEARMTGKSELNAKSDVLKIDTVNPVVKKASLSSWNMNYQQKIDITLTDAHSGVGGYCIKTDKNKPSASDGCFEDVRLPAYGGTKTISVYKPQGTYYIFVKDRVGNVSDYDPNNSNLSFSVKDSTPPTCKIVVSGTKGNNGWYTSNVTIKLDYSDTESGVRAYELNQTGKQPSVDHYSGKNSFSITSDIYTGKNYYYGYVEDKAGNKSSCKLVDSNGNLIDVKRDTTKPTCGISTSGTKGNNGWYKSDITGAFSSKSDNLSGVASYGLSYSSSVSYNSKTTLNGHADSASAFYIYGFVKDAAGNVNSCKSPALYKDTVAPKVTGVDIWYETGEEYPYRGDVHVVDSASGFISEQNNTRSKYCYRSGTCSFDANKMCNNSYSISQRPGANVWSKSVNISNNYGKNWWDVMMDG